MWKVKRSWIEWAGTAAMIAIAVALCAAHFLHLKADFPNFSPWMDYAKYTDEGWYGNAAIAYFLRGGWYVPGDFNPAVALPVWPFLEWVLFHFTGVSLTAARALAVVIFGGNVALMYALLRSQAPRWVALLGTVVVASNAFLYCFSRLAILEPLLIAMMLLSWLLVLSLNKLQAGWRRTALLICLGLLVMGMVLTKTTAVFLFPALLYLLWRSSPLEGSQTWRGFSFSTGIVAISAALPWLAYYLLLVRPRYLQDYRYLFTANVYPQPTNASGWLMAFWYSMHGALWIDPKLGVLAAALLVLSLLFFRNLWKNPLFVASFLAAAGYLFFIGFHNNMQPRYYQVVAFPLVIMAVLAMQALFMQRFKLGRIAGAVSLAMIAVTVFVNVRETVWFAFHPQYTFVDAAQNLTRYVDQHPNRNRMLLSISGSNIALITGLPAICDDFGTLDLPERIRRYQPGWYAAWNEIDPGTLEDLHTQFSLKEVASFPAYDDEDRDNLILYKMIPLAETAPSPPPRHRARKPGQPAQQSRPAQLHRVAE